MKTFMTYFDETNLIWKKSEEHNGLFLSMQEKYFNHRLATVGFVFLNEILAALNIKRTNDGQLYGWSSRQANASINMTIEPDLNASFLLTFRMEFIGNDVDIIEGAK